MRGEGDEGLWGSMGGGGVSDEEEGGEGRWRPPPPHRTPPPPSQAATKTPPPPTPLKKTFERTVRVRVRLREPRRGDPP